MREQPTRPAGNPRRVLAKTAQARRPPARAELVADIEAAILAPGSADFARLMACVQVELGLNDRSLSALIQMDRTTVNRWIRGVTTPHPSFRKAILQQLLAELRGLPDHRS